MARIFPIAIVSAVFAWLVLCQCSVSRTAGSEPRQTGETAAKGTLEPAALLPLTFGDGWRAVDAVKRYDADTLHTYVNGDAALYKSYGFEALAVGEYASNNERVSVDLYRMGSPQNALGIFSNYRSSNGTPARVGADGMISDYQLLFYQGRYLVRLSASGDVEANRKVLQAAAEAIAAQLPV